MKIKTSLLIVSAMLTMGVAGTQAQQATQPTQVQNSNSSESLEFLQKCMKEPEPVTILKMGDSINMENLSSYAPFVTADELTLFFTSDRKAPYSSEMSENSIESSFVAHRTSLESNWEIDNLSRVVNAKLNDGVAGISPDGQRIFVHRNSNDIYVLDRDVWSKASFQSIGKYYNIKLNRKYHISSCAISADGNTFYITTNMPGGLGGYDVWMCKRGYDMGRWSDWQNMGASVNTVGDEMTVSALPDNSSLFVASNGRLGFGGYDLYRFDRLGENNYEVVHLGFPINTINNDVYYYTVPNATVKGKGAHAYYSTERSTGSNLYDIYFVDYQDEILSERNKAIKRGEYEAYMQKRAADSIAAAAEAQRKMDSIALAAAKAAAAEAEARAKAALAAADAQSKAALDAAKAREDSLLAAQQRIQQEAADREAALRAAQQRREDSLQNALKKQYDDALAKKGYTDLGSIQNPTKGMKVYLNNILFDKGKATLMAASYYELNKVLDFMKRFPNVRIEVGGHTSSEGGYALNQRLSEARAKSVREYLIEQGVSPERITFRGYNYSKPIESERTESGKGLNRRVEFIIL